MCLICASNFVLCSSCVVERNVEAQGRRSSGSAKPWDSRRRSVNEKAHEVLGGAARSWPKPN